MVKTPKASMGLPGGWRAFSEFPFLTVTPVVTFLTIRKLDPAIAGPWSTLLGHCRVESEPSLVKNTSRLILPYFSDGEKTAEKFRNTEI